MTTVDPQTTPPRTPPGWLNTLMRTMLKTPLLQRLPGRSTALIEYVGRKSGRSYEIPVTYARHGSNIIITGHRSRQWWRNLESHPEVRLRLAGRTCAGRTRRLDGEESIDRMSDFMAANRMVAKASGVEFGEDGRPSKSSIVGILAHSVVLEVTIDPERIG